MREISQIIESDFIPIVEAAGFHWVDYDLCEKDSPVSASEIRLERQGDGVIDSIIIGFAKYDTPAFQILCDRRIASGANEFIRAGGLVKNPKQYYYQWGKPWWVPSRFWRTRDNARIVRSVCSKCEQLFKFIDTGVRGPNIARSAFEEGARLQSIEELEGKVVR